DGDAHVHLVAVGRRQARRGQGPVVQVGHLPAGGRCRQPVRRGSDDLGLRNRLRGRADRPGGGGSEGRQEALRDREGELAMGARGGSMKKAVRTVLRPRWLLVALVVAGLAMPVALLVSTGASA